MRLLYICQLFFIAAAVAASSARLERVVPCLPWNGCVDIQYSITCNETDEQGNAAEVHVDFLYHDDERNVDIPMRIQPKDGRMQPGRNGGFYTVTWYAGPKPLDIQSLMRSVRLETATAATAEYLVVDLSGGPTAEQYPVRYSRLGPPADSEQVRQSDLWLKRIDGGKLPFGGPFLSKKIQTFYIGIYECTQRQWELVMGSNPSSFDQASCYSMRPVENITADMLVGGLSFMERLKKKTGLPFDVPTEFEWEYACRGGTKTEYNSGEPCGEKGADAALTPLGRYWLNGGQGYRAGCDTRHGTARVGSYRPNGWGLYDMHGNVAEWCRKTTGRHLSAVPLDAEYVLCGGSWSDEAAACRSDSRVSASDSIECVSCNGFRTVCRWSAPLRERNVVSCVQEPQTWRREDVRSWQEEHVIDSAWRLIPAGTAIPSDCPYLVIDVYGGLEADHYPVYASQTGPNLIDESSRTWQIWLKKIQPGHFQMGSDAAERGHKPDETLHDVTLTRTYFIGVLECTQRQWELLTGTRPSFFDNDIYYAKRPVESVSYEDIRGDGWPSEGHRVGKSTFMGRLQAKTGFPFDLPTEAQWEFACRAGRTENAVVLRDFTIRVGGLQRGRGGLVNSKSIYYSSGTTLAGMEGPNDWGLYEMIGNVSEWCLDWYGNWNEEPVTEPVGAEDGRFRVIRGHAWSTDKTACRISSRSFALPSGDAESVIFKSTGFRIALELTSE